MRIPSVPSANREGQLRVGLTHSARPSAMAAICAFETFGVGESTFGGHVCRAGPPGAVVTKNSPCRAFWEELVEARQIAGALIF